MDLSINPNRRSIIDMHTHAGTWKGHRYGLNDLESLNTNLGEDKVDMFILSNVDCFDKEGSTPRKNEIIGNTELINEVKNKENMTVMMVGNPKNGNVENLKLIYEKAKDKVVGIKFHPRESGLVADSELYDSYLKFAEENNLPCLFHSQCDGSTNITEPSDPRKIHELAKRHPNVPVILGHTGAGGEAAHNVAINTIIESIDNNDSKLYADISWMNWKDDLPSEEKPSVIRLIKEMKQRGKTDRILFGTDAPLGCFGEKQVNGIGYSDAYKKTIDTLKNAIKKEFPDEWEQLSEDILYNNSKKLFFSNKPKKTIQNQTPTNNKYLKPLMIVGGVVLSAAIATGAFLLNRNKKN